MEYKFRYAPTAIGGPGKRGRNPNPNVWNTGPDPVQHDKYYSYLKHRSQAKFRGEHYELTWEQWDHMWTVDKWMARGRGRSDLCLTRLDCEKGWTVCNIQIVTKQNYLKSKKGANSDQQRL